jgi:restriction system protein
MAVPDFQTIMLPVLKIVRQGDCDASEVVNKISDEFKLSEEDRNQKIPSGGMPTIRNRVQWALTYLTKANLAERPKRGIFRITDLGEKTLSKNPTKIDMKYLEQFDGYLAFKEKSGKKLNENNNHVKNDLLPSQETPEDLIGHAYESFEQSTKDEILELILKSSPLFFERLILDLFQAMNYGGRGGDASHVGRTGDGGIDGIINEDPLGLEKIYLQAKRYNVDNKISIDQIRSFAGALLDKRARKGIFVTTSSFVASAYEYANNSTHSIVLIDGEELTRLMYEYDVGVRTVQTIKLKKPDMDYFEEL